MGDWEVGYGRLGSKRLEIWGLRYEIGKFETGKLEIGK